MADIVAKVENRTPPKISRKSIFRRRYCCNALRGRYEDRWSFLYEMMWSLTSRRAKRISGSKKIRSSAGKDFFNSIRQKRSIGLEKGISVFCLSSNTRRSYIHSIDGAVECWVGLCASRDYNFLLTFSESLTIARCLSSSRLYRPLVSTKR